MEFEPTKLPEVVLIKPRVFGESRGFFFESWHQQKLAAAGIGVNFVQNNHSHSQRHTLRGLHYQIPPAQGKLVRVTRGAVFDVAVDIRRGSACDGRCPPIALRCSRSRMPRRRCSSTPITIREPAHHGRC